MDTQRLSHVIGLIYESSQDLDIWPLLLQELAAVLYEGGEEALPFPQVEGIERLGDYVSHWYLQQPGEQQLLQTHHYSGEEHELIKMVLPHLLRAMKLNRQFLEVRVENQAMASVMEHLPIGMVVVDADARIYAKNQRFTRQLSQDNPLKIQAGHLVLSQPSDNKRLQAVLHEVLAATKATSNSGQALRLGGNMPLSLLVLPLLQESLTAGLPRLIIFVSTGATEVEVDAHALQGIYGLSRAESRLTMGLVQGHSLEEMAEDFHVSKHTLRTQLKSVYAKTDCSRQAELVVKVLTSPAILSSGKEQAKPGHSLRLEDIPQDLEPRHNQNMFLADGRNLSFAEYGPVDGYPVVMSHGINGSRFQVSRDETVLHRHGIRLFIPERPGIGRSDPLPERSILDWADDLLQFIDFLDAEQVGLIGYSVGASFALGAALRMPERISQLVLLSGMGTFKGLSDLKGMTPLFRMLMGLGRYSPAIALSFMRLTVHAMKRKPEQYFERATEYVPQSDRELFAEPAMQQAYAASVYESMYQGERDLMMELLLISRDWGFRPEEIQLPVTMWHGALDTYVPLHMAQSMAKRLPHAYLNIVPAAGHLLLYRNWEEVIDNLRTSLDMPALALERKS